MKYYYALFKNSAASVEVTFPDLPGCVTFGDTWDEAVVNATDVLAGWLANAEAQFVKEPTSHAALQGNYPQAQLVPIAVDERILSSYEELKRVNIIIPKNLLERIDKFRKKRGLKRSTLLRQAAEEFLKKNH